MQSHFKEFEKILTLTAEKTALFESLKTKSNSKGKDISQC